MLSAPVLNLQPLQIFAEKFARAQVECDRPLPLSGLAISNWGRKMESQVVKPVLTLTIGSPPENSPQVTIGENLTVTGLVGGVGGAEPTVPESVTVRLGNLQPVRATLKPPPFSQGGNWTYAAVFESVELPAGPNILIAEAFFASNESVVVDETVFVSTGIPLESTFTANVTLQTSSAEAAGPYHDTISAQVFFSGDRKNVTFRFPSLSVGGATVTLIAGGIGTLDVTTTSPSFVSGVMNVPVTLKFSHQVNGDSTLEINLTTGAEQSPHGNFKDTGSPLNAFGYMTLVGDGIFMGGLILNNCDASLVLQGAFSPAPLTGVARHIGDEVADPGRSIVQVDAAP